MDCNLEYVNVESWIFILQLLQGIWGSSIRFFFLLMGLTITELGNYKL